MADYQLARLNDLLATVQQANPFYARKLQGQALPLVRLDQLRELPFTTKSELSAGAIPNGQAFYAANRTFDLDRYVRFHQTSGTQGRPLAVLDTADDWRWWIDTWQYVLDAAEVTAQDRALLAFSFGPFIGFWSAHDALMARGTLIVPCGGLSTRGRLEMIETSRATVVFCTPTYALRMAEAADESGISLRASSVERLVVAGEPGGSLPAVRQRIESAWGARVIDHSGATEVGPWGFGDREGRGLRVIESEFIAELLAPGTSQPAPPGSVAELVLTSLGRVGAPVIRYRTGDLVRASRPTSGTCRFLFLEGGILGRTDDMLVIRGVNVFPSSIEAILREFPSVAEFRMTASRQGSLDQLAIEVEDAEGQPERVAQQLERRLGLRIDVRTVPMGSLPRFEAKSRRFVDRRKNVNEG